MNVGAILIILLLALAFLGIPIVFAIGLSTIVAILIGGMPLMVYPQKIFTGMDSTALLAIPFFLLAGNIMSIGLTKRIINISNASIGNVKGSLGIVTVVASSIFSAISGSSIATTAAIGGVTIPAMKEEGYDVEFAAALTGISSTLGTLIPPSIFLIVYGSATESSIVKLFMAAFVPGITMSIVLCVYAYLYASKHNFPVRESLPFKEKVKVFKEGLWAMLMPVVILGGIFLGIFTATEAAAVSAVYALIVTGLVYKEMKWKDVKDILIESAISTSALVILVGFSKVSSWVIVTSKFPDLILNAFTSITSSSFGIMLLLNILLLIVGMFMEGNAAIIMLTPLILPMLNTYGISTITFGVVMAMNLSLGLVTPPVGSCLLMANQIADAKLGGALKKVLVPLGLSIAVLLLTTYFPPMTLWLPSIMK